jgi:GT2 family glycosyltransferase/SAM-dependent methyltransferase
MAAAVASQAETIAALTRERDDLRAELRKIHTSKLWRLGATYWSCLRALGLVKAPPEPVSAVAVFPAKESAPLSEAPDLADAYKGIADAAAVVAPRGEADGHALPGGPAFDVVCFSIIEWDFRFQRPQQLLSQLADRGHRVFYVSQVFRPDGPAVLLRKIRPNVWEVSLRGPRKNVYREDLSQEQVETFFESLDALRREEGLGATVSVVQLPFWTPIVEVARSRLSWPVVYDCMDFHAGFSTNETAMLARERQLLSGADLVVVSSRFLEHEAAPLARRVVRIPNACDFDAFAAIPAPASKPVPVIGYYGAIADWFDSDLVADLAERRPDWCFLLVGSTYTADMSRLSALPNVETPGEVPYAELPRWIERMDVLLIPFRRTPLTEATNPVKAYEILAAGRPLVSVPLPEVVALGDLVRLAETPEEMEREVLAALSGDTPEARRRRQAFAREQTWAHRVEALAPAIEEAFPKVSVVVVTWNNREWNARCLASLREKNDWPNLEVIVVDNASTDGSPELLRQEAARDGRIRLVLNDTNAGFAAANNQGLALATGDVLVLLNNDTAMTRGALASLVRHLRAEPTIGLLGPSTNEIANEGKVAVGYSSLDELPAWAATFVREHDGELVETAMLAMFCLAMTRETWIRTGPLDERFEVGMFEDDDYSRRVKELGLRTVCARDAFVHHAGRASFGALGDARYLDIFNKNKARYELKWGLWLPHVAPEALKMVPAFRNELAFRMEQAGADPSRVVVFLPTIGWNIALVQRPHHLARALARAGYFVVFDCSNSAAESFGGFQEVEKNLLLFRGPVEILTGLDAPILWTLPYNAGLVDSWPTRRIVYDCIDDLAVFPYNQDVLRGHHERMLREADVVACVSRPLLEECRRVRPETLYLPNAVDVDHFAEAPARGVAPAALRPVLEAGRPILGYYGALASWLDVDLLEAAARLRPDWSFVLVGIQLADAPSLEALERLPNVFVLPPQPYRDIPAVLACFDVAFIPFVVNEITHATSPLKLFEYFAGGKPVISSPMPECAAFPEVRIACNAGELAGALDAALLDSRDADHRARLRRVAAENSWKARVHAVATAIAPGATPPWPGEPAPGRLQGVERFTYQGQHQDGRCCVCGEASQFTYADPASFRESLVCRVCGSTSRYRSVARGLLRAIADLGGPRAESLGALPKSCAGPRLRVFDTQQPFSAPSCAYALPDLLAACDWIEVEIGLFRPSDPPGTRYGPHLTNQDLQGLAFPDGSFDIVVTSDVMEHVRLDEVAHREIHRVLTDGGIYLFTVPHSRSWPRTLVRRRVVDPEDPSRDEDLLPPEYHGDANAPEGGALSYRAYGTDLDRFLSSVGFSVDYTREDRPELGIRSTELFYCRKVHAVPLACPIGRG